MQEYEFYIELLNSISKKGTCLRKQVGAIIVKDGKIISNGFNTSPIGFGTCKELGCMVIDNHCIRTVHAEINALLKAGKEAERGIMFCSTLPCIHCIKTIIQSGIQKIIYLEDYNKESVDYWLNITNIEVLKWKKN